MDPLDRIAEQERHNRRMTLMRMQGDLNRREAAAHRWMVVACVLGALAIFGMLIS